MGRKPAEEEVEQKWIEEILRKGSRLPFCLLDMREQKVAGKFANYTVAKLARSTLIRLDSSNERRYVIAIENQQARQGKD